MATRDNRHPIDKPGKNGQKPGKRWQKLADAAYVAWQKKRFGRQLELLVEACEVAKNFAPGDYRLTYSLSSLGDVLLWKGDPKNALPLLRGALRSAMAAEKKNNQEIASRLMELANCYADLNKFNLSIKYFNDASVFLKRLKADNPVVLRYHELFFHTLFSRGTYLMSKNKYGEAHEALALALKSIKPTMKSCQLRKARVKAGMAVCRQYTGDFQRALSLYDRTIDLHLNGAVATVDDIKYLSYYIREIGKSGKHARAALKLEKKLLRAAELALAGKRLTRAPRRPTKETLHARAVSDPYRWLEDLAGEKTQRWIDAQCDYSAFYLSHLPGRFEITNKLLNAYSSPSYSVPVRRKNRYFFQSHKRSQPQTALFTFGRVGETPRLVVEPAKLVNGENRWISGYFISPDSRYFAYGVNEGGSDWLEWFVYDMSKGKLLSDHLTGSKDDFVVWSKDSKSFFYVRFARPRDNVLRTAVNRCPGIYLHRLGTDQESDTLVYRRDDKPDWYLGLGSDTERKVLVIGAWHEKDTNNRVFAKRFSKLKAPAEAVFPDADARYHFVDASDGQLFFITDKDAPRRRLVAAPLSGGSATARDGEVPPGRGSATARDGEVPPGRGRATARDGEAPPALREVIPERDAVLLGVLNAGKTLVAHYLTEQHSRLLRFSKRGRLLGEIALPFEGTVTEVNCTIDDKELFFGITSFTTPEVICRHDLERGKTTIVLKPRNGFDGSRFVTRQVYVASRDGTMFPMLLAHKRNLKRTGDNPTLLAGYGGFNVNMTPAYSYDIAAWLDMGGVYALPALRGGGEYGSKWHRLGSGKNKQNTFDDFISAAEWLIESGITQSKKLAISGASNGGLTVGAVLTQRPNLFGAAVVCNGLFDMLRFHLSTLAWTWHAEFGSIKKRSDFEIIWKYSPYHRIASASYPATLIIAGELDDRVLPWHSYKFAAALQHAQKGKAPVLLKVERHEGHGASRPSDRLADQLVFLAFALGMEETPGKTGAPPRRARAT